MAQWRRNGITVIVALPDDLSEVEAQLRRASYGVVSVDGRHRVLSLEEAYYALAEDRLLETSNESTLDDVWHDFTTASSGRFKAQYALYRHFRRHGWLLRSGLNYGTQYVLYRGDADVYHSEYIVYLQHTAVSSWHGLQALTRIAADVKKTVLLCQVSLENVVGASDNLHGRDSNSSAAQITTQGRYKIHGETFIVDVVLIRHWDSSTVDEDRESYIFTPQPIIHKRKPRATKKRTAKGAKEKTID